MLVVVSAARTCSAAARRLTLSYALFYASRGAKVLVNDLGPAASDKNKKAADVVVEEIKSAGGEAIAADPERLPPRIADRYLELKAAGRL